MQEKREGQEGTRGVADRYRVSTDPRDVDLEAVHAYLSRSYWAEAIPTAVLAQAVAHSLCFSLLDRDRHIGLARVVTDRATFAYLCDVYLLEEYQRQGLGTLLMEHVVSHPDLQGLRRFVLVTRDAHGLYEKFGFAPIENVGGYMEIVRRQPYAGTGPGPRPDR